HDSAVGVATGGMMEVSLTIGGLPDVVRLTAAGEQVIFGVGERVAEAEDGGESSGICVGA
ncbi:unnamed protein product, partial [Musa acuminata subsp. burmannicoides]